MSVRQRKHGRSLLSVLSDTVQRSFTNVLLQVGDVLPVLSQGLEDLQPIREVLVAGLVVPDHFEEVSPQRAQPLPLHTRHTEHKRTRGVSGHIGISDVNFGERALRPPTCP